LGEPDGVLILDGSAVPKRGGHSAGRRGRPMVWGHRQDRQLPSRRLPGLRQPQGLYAAGPPALPPRAVVRRGACAAVAGLPHSRRDRLPDQGRTGWS
jgi:hypothetical protein